MQLKRQYKNNEKKQRGIDEEVRGSSQVSPARHVVRQSSDEVTCDSHQPSKIPGMTSDGTVGLGPPPPQRLGRAPVPPKLPTVLKWVVWGDGRGQEVIGWSKEERAELNLEVGRLEASEREDAWKVVSRS